STVGLPRLSRISRAWTAITVLIVARTLPCLLLESNHRCTHLVAQAFAVAGLESRRRNGSPDEKTDRSRTQTPRAFGEDFERVRDVNGHDGYVGRDREAEGGVLERQQLPGATAGALWKHNNGRGAALDRARRFVVRLECLLVRGAVDRNVSD